MTAAGALFIGLAAVKAVMGNLSKAAFLAVFGVPFSALAALLWWLMARWPEWGRRSGG